MRKFSLGIIWSRGSSASILPNSTMALPRSMRLMVPETRWSLRSIKSLKICSRSASRIFWKITCLAACASMRPKSTDSSGSSMNSSIWMPGLHFCASDSLMCRSGVSNVSSSITCQRRKEEYSPVSRSMLTLTSASSVIRFLVAEASAASNAPNTSSLSTLFSRAKASTNNKTSRFITVSNYHAFAERKHLYRSECRHQARLVQIGQHYRHLLAFHIQLQHPILDFTQNADEILASFHRHAQLDARLLAAKTHKIRFFFQWPIQSRRRHLQPVIVHALYHKQTCQLVADPLAIIQRNAAGLVEKHPVQTASRNFQVNQFVPQTRQRRSHQPRHIHNFCPQIKNGPEAHLEIAQIIAGIFRPAHHK